MGEKVEYHRIIGIPLGPLLFALMLLLPPLTDPMTGEVMNKVAPWAPNAGIGLLLWAVVWWLTEALPYGVTSLTIAVVACALVGTACEAFGYKTVKAGIVAVLETFFDPTIWVFFGGFVLGFGMLESGFARRVARRISMAFGRVSANAFWSVVGLWTVCWFISWWMSNTAATAVVYPVMLGALAASPWINDKQAELSLIFLAYAAGLGGLATIIGTPPNLIVAAFLKNFNIAEIGFVKWLYYGMPIAIITLILMIIIGRVLFGKSTIDVKALERAWQEQPIKELTLEEKWFAFVFAVTVFLWIFRGVADVLGWKAVTAILPDDAIPAIICAILMFGAPRSLKPYKPIFDWKKGASEMEWDTLFLFAGGLVMGTMLFNSGAGLWLGKQALRIFGASPIGITLGGATISWVVTQFTSNTATTNMVVPIVISLGQAAKLPANLIASASVVAAIMASIAFTLPISTPPNAIVFGSGRVRVSRMILYGLIMSAVTAPVTLAISMIATGVI